MQDEVDFVCVPLSNIDKNTMTFKNPDQLLKINKNSQILLGTGRGGANTDRPNTAG